MVTICYRSIKQLKSNKNGLLNISSLKPLKENKVLKILKRYKKIITIEDHYKHGGLGSLITDIIARNNLKVKFVNHGMKKGFIDSDIPKNQEKNYKLDINSITNLIKKT